MITGYWSATSLAASTSTSWARVSGIPDTQFQSLYQIFQEKSFKWIQRSLFHDHILVVLPGTLTWRVRITHSSRVWYTCWRMMYPPWAMS